MRGADLIDRAQEPATGRLHWYAAVAVAAALIAAFCLYDASAEIGVGPRPTVQRATVGAW